MNEPKAQAAGPGHSTGSKWLMLALLVVARTTMGLQFQTVADVSGHLVSALGISWHEVGRLIGLYMLPGVFIALPGAMLGRRFGDKRLVVLSLLMMTAGGALMAVADSYGLLTVGRVASGIGGVVVNVLMTKMVADWFPGRQVSFAMAILIVSWPLGIALGLVINGQLLTFMPWQGVMWLSAAFSLASMFLVWLGYREPKAATASSASSGFSFDLTRPEAILCCLAGCIWSFYNVGFIMLPSFGADFFVSVGYGEVEAAYLVSLASWLLIVLVPLGGYIATHWGFQKLILFGSFAVGAVGMAWIPLSSSPVPVFIIVGSLSALPASLIMSLPAGILRPEARATGMGLYFSMYYLGFAILPEVAGWARDVTGSAGAPIQFGGLMILVATLFLIFFLLFKRHFSEVVTPT